MRNVALVIALLIWFSARAGAEILVPARDVLIDQTKAGDLPVGKQLSGFKWSEAYFSVLAKTRCSHVVCASAEPGSRARQCVLPVPSTLEAISDLCAKNSFGKKSLSRTAYERSIARKHIDNWRFSKAEKRDVKATSMTEPHLFELVPAETVPSASGNRFPDPFKAVAAKEELGQTFQHMLDLPQHQMEAVALKTIGYSDKELAKMLGVGEEAARLRLRRGLQELNLASGQRMPSRVLATTTTVEEAMVLHRAAARVVTAPALSRATVATQAEMRALSRSGRGSGSGIVGLIALIFPMGLGATLVIIIGSSILAAARREAA